MGNESEMMCGCILCPHFSLLYSEAVLIQRAEDGRRRKEWETAEMMHTLTCNAVDDLSSIVRKPKLLPPQWLASLLVSELVPGKKGKKLREKETSVLLGGIHFKKQYGIWSQGGTMGTQKGGRGINPPCWFSRPEVTKELSTSKSQKCQKNVFMFISNGWTFSFLARLQSGCVYTWN